MNEILESVHGGPDAQGVAEHDFSTNANACGPCPAVLEAVQRADASRYPDPHYAELREQLGAFHGVSAERVVMAASASEFMHRISAMAARRGVRHARVPAHGYGDYSRAAQAWGLVLTHDLSVSALHWACEPSSPLGSLDVAVSQWLRQPDAADWRVLDCAYAPLRLDGQSAIVPETAWQLWTPNKALALTGVRAAYAIAPAHVSPAQLHALRAMAASWPVGAHGVAMLQAWTGAAAQRWLRESLVTLNRWKSDQMLVCDALGWHIVGGSLANYFTARLPAGCDMLRLLTTLRTHGIKLRDCASFGLPQHVRLGVLPPVSQAALKRHAMGEYIQ